MDPTEEFLAYIDSLPPSTQQSLIQYVMAGGDPNVGGTAPFGAGPMNTGRLGGQLQGPLGVSPYDPMSVGAAYAYTPQLDKYGNEQPFDLGTAQQNLNLVKAQQGSLLNPAFTMQAGAGAYAPGTFDPMPQAPGEYDMLLGTYATYGPTTYQGFIAERVASGIPPEQALNEFWAAAQNPENPQAEALMASLPTKYVQQSNPMDPSAAPQMVAVEGGDKEAPQRLVYSLTDAQMKQVPQAPQYGAAAQEYLDQGIPFPTERYGEGNYSMEATVPGYAEAQSGYQAAQDRVKSLRAASDPQAIQQAQAKYLTGVNEAARSTPTPTQTTPPRGVNAAPNSFSPDYARAERVPRPEGGSTIAGITAQPVATGNMSMPPPDLARRVAANHKTAVEAQRNNAVKARDEAYFAANTPEAVYAETMNRMLNKRGRTPTQDTLMARQLANYMMGVYGPRG
jgi:hypothetical protein